MVYRSNVSTMQCMHRSPTDHALLHYLTVYTSTEILLTQGDANQTCYIVFSTTEQFSILGMFRYPWAMCDCMVLSNMLCQYVIRLVSALFDIDAKSANCNPCRECTEFSWCMLCCRLYNHHLSKANRFINCHACCHVTCTQHVEGQLLQPVCEKRIPCLQWLLQLSSRLLLSTVKKGPCHSNDSVCLDGRQNSHKAVLAELKEPWVEVRDMKETL